MPSSKFHSQLDESSISAPSSRNTRFAWSVLSRRRNTIVASILLLLLFFTATFKTTNVILLWRWVDPTNLGRPYRAPMFACQWGDAINGSYGVFLHHGCSLDKHKQLIGEDADLDSKITLCSPETKVHGLYYYANDIDDEILDAIRADIVVDLVECNRSPDNLAEPQDVEIINPREL